MKLIRIQMPIIACRDISGLRCRYAELGGCMNPHADGGYSGQECTITKSYWHVSEKDFPAVLALKLKGGKS